MSGESQPADALPDSGPGSGAEIPDLDADAVAAWLGANPDFFANRDELLETLVLPHDAGEGISLMERQVHRFREQRTDLETRLAAAESAARGNETLFHQCKQLVLRLVDGVPPKPALSRLEISLATDFRADDARIVLFDEDHTAAEYVDLMSRDDAPELVDNLAIRTGANPESESTFLFGHGDVASAATIPLGANKDSPGVGILAIGSRNPHHFEPGQGVLFLEFLRDVVMTILRDGDAASDA